MSFLNVGAGELAVVLIIAILLVGPQRMVEIARTIGQMTGQLSKLTNEFTATLQSEIQATEREMRNGMGDIRAAFETSPDGERQQSDKSGSK